MDLMLGDPPSPRQRGYKGSYGDAVNRITRLIQVPVCLNYLISPEWLAHLPQGFRHLENVDRPPLSILLSAATNYAIYCVDA